MFLFWSHGLDRYRKNDRKRTVVRLRLVLELCTVLALTQLEIRQSDWWRAGIRSTNLLMVEYEGLNDPPCYIPSSYWSKLWKPYSNGVTADLHQTFSVTENPKFPGTHKSSNQSIFSFTELFKDFSNNSWASGLQWHSTHFANSKKKNSACKTSQDNICNLSDHRQPQKKKWNNTVFCFHISNLGINLLLHFYSYQD